MMHTGRIIVTVACVLALGGAAWAQDPSYVFFVFDLEKSGPPRASMAFTSKALCEVIAERTSRLYESPLIRGVLIPTFGPEHLYSCVPLIGTSAKAAMEAGRELDAILALIVPR